MEITGKKLQIMDGTILENAEQKIALKESKKKALTITKKAYSVSSVNSSVCRYEMRLAVKNVRRMHAFYAGIRNAAGCFRTSWTGEA